MPPRSKKRKSISSTSSKYQPKSPIGDTFDSPEADNKTFKLIVSGTVTLNVFILSAAISLFVLLPSCDETADQTGQVAEPHGTGLGQYPGNPSEPSPDLTPIGQYPGNPSEPSPGPTPISTFPSSPNSVPASSPSTIEPKPISNFPSSSNSMPSGSSSGPTPSKFDVISNPNHQCGISDIQPDLQRGRIVGGAEAVPNSWPFTVGVGIVELVGGNQFSIMQMCGGTLISPRHVLTAAHCFRGDQNIRSTYSVYVGVHSTKTYKGALPKRVAFVNIHPKTNVFDGDLWVVYDLAVLTLVNEIIPNAKMQFACLPTLRKVLPEGTICWATGWGKTQGTGADKLLKQVVVDVVSEKTCQRMYNPKIVMKSVLCGGTTRGQDTCQGDSGGPLLHKEDGKWTLYGVTSYGSGDCGSGPLSAYATVSYNLEWICCFMQNMPACNGIKCNLSGEN